MKIGLIRFLQLVVGIALTFLLCSCGGSGAAVASFSSAGTLTFEKEIVVDTAAVDLFDPSSVLRISAPAGAITSGQKVKIEVWSNQRDLVKLKNFTQSPVAADLLIAPGALQNNPLFVDMVGVTSPGIGSIISAFGPDGKVIALPRVDGATSPMIRGQINAEMLAFLGGTTPTSMEPIRVQLVVQNPNSAPLAPRNASESNPVTLKTLWSAPTDSRTSYAGRKRIAFVLSGALDDVSTISRISAYLKQGQGKDGKPESPGVPFDQITGVEYDWTDTISASANRLVSVLAPYMDPDKFELHFFGHGEGGLVCRWAIEQIGLPSAKRLYMIGTPQKGYPLPIISQLLLQFGPKSGNSTIPEFGRLEAGLLGLLEAKPTFETLASSKPPSTIQYYVVDGQSAICSPYGVNVGTPASLLYRSIGDGPSDGLVSAKSAIYNPAISGVLSNSVSKGHFQLGDLIPSYFTTGNGSNWLVGVNRDIKTLTSKFASDSVLTGSTLNLKVKALDKDGDELDPKLMFDLQGATRADAMKWITSDPLILSINPNAQDFTAIITGLRAGTATVTVKDPKLGASFTFTINVLENSVLITPNKPDLQLREIKTFLATPVSGTFTTGAKFTWGVREGSLRAVGSSGSGTNFITVDEPTIEYIAPDKVVQDEIELLVFDGVSNALIASGKTKINVGAPFRITPNGSVVPSSGFQKFTVEALGNNSLPTGGSYKWTVSGGGRLSGTTTTEPTVDYTAPDGQADPIVSVEILNADGSKAGMTSTTVKVRPGNFQFTSKNINSFISTEIVNGDYNGPLVQIGQGIVGSVYRIGLIFGVTEGPGVTQDTAAWIVQIAISQGTKLQVGQTFPQGAVNKPGVFYASSVLTPSGGTMKILTVTENADGTYTYTFSMSLDAYPNITSSDPVNVINGTGTFTLAY